MDPIDRSRRGGSGNGRQRTGSGRERWSTNRKGPRTDHGGSGTKRGRQRGPDVARLRDEAAEQATALTTASDWLRLLRYAEHFHHLGGVNALLILRNRPHATRLAGYEDWQREGCQVQRGERGITLIHPSAPTRTIRVFDVTQTGRPPEPGPLTHLRPSRHSPTELRSALVSVAMRKGHDVIRRPPDGGAMASGLSPDTRTIRLHPELTDEAACAGLSHELARVLLDHDSPAACHGRHLIEAESTAYIICRHVGLDVGVFTFPAPATWAGTDPRAHRGSTVLAAIERIGKAADSMIHQIDAIARGRAPAARPTPELATSPASQLTPGMAAEPTIQSTPQPARTGRQASLGKPSPDPADVATVDAPTAPATGRLVAAHRQAERFFTQQLPNSWVPAYLEARGLAAALDDSAQWSLGYAPASWTALVDHLRDHRYTDDEIIASGLGKRARTGGLIDRFRDRAIVPVRTPDGITIAFIGRTNPEAPPTDGHPVPKYLNSPQTPLFTKGAMLFGLDAATRRLDAGAVPVLVEGTLDAIAIHLADTDQRYAPVAPSGTALTAAQVTALAGAVALGDRGIIVAFDGDPAGQHAATRAHKLLSEHTNRLHHAELAAGTDPAQLLETRGPQAIMDGLANLRPLAATVLTEHLETTRDLTDWDRCERAASLIARLTRPSETAALAGANNPGPDSHPGNAAVLTAEAAALLLPAATNHLVATAAEAIDVPINRVMYDVIEAAIDRAQQQARMEKSGDALHPARTGTRDAGPDPPTITAAPGTVKRSRTPTEAPPQHPRRP